MEREKSWFVYIRKAPVHGFPSHRPAYLAVQARGTQTTRKAGLPPLSRNPTSESDSQLELRHFDVQAKSELLCQMSASFTREKGKVYINRTVEGTDMFWWLSTFYVVFSRRYGRAAPQSRLIWSRPLQSEPQTPGSDPWLEKARRYLLFIHDSGSFIKGSD